MSRADRFFRRLLKLFPAEFRGDFGDDMAATFGDQRRDVLARGGSIAALRLWADTIRGILTTAPREHYELLRADVRYGLRNLRRSPAFTATAVLALAVGIGANTAVFSIVNGVLINALPYERPEHLVVIFEKMPRAPVDKFDFSAPDFEILRETARSYSGIAAFRNATYELSGTAAPERLDAARVSPEIFGVLGVSPLLGRAFTADEDRDGAKVTVLSHGLWTRAFGRDQSIVGRAITLDRQPYTVVGIMPDRFEFPPRGSANNGRPAALFVPIAFSPLERQAFGSMYNNTVIARLKPGVSVEQARTELGSIARTIADRYPPAMSQWRDQLSLPMSPYADDVVGGSRRMLLVLMGAVGLLLLIGCVDVANLMLTRAGSRHRELAVRSALGASAARVVRQLLTEGLVLAVIGGAAGVLLAYWTMQALLAFAGDTLPRAESIGFDAQVVAFAAVLALMTPLVFGVVPALRAALGSTFDALKEGGRGATPGPGRHRLLGSLVVAQFALALMLSVGAGLLMRSFFRLLGTEPGFRVEQVVSARATLPAGRYANGQQVKAFYQQAVEAARSIPGVSAAGAGNDLPLNVLERRTFTPDPSAQQIDLLSRVIANTWTAGSYFEALGIPLKQGRFFTDTDGRTGERVIILNELLARALWPTASAVGRRIKWGGDTSQAPWMTIVGVVGNVKQATLDRPTIAQAYEPFSQLPDQIAASTIIGLFRTVNLAVRSEGEPEALIARVRSELQRLDPALPITHARALTDLVGESVKPQRFSMTVVSVFALLALGLAAIGIYGVLANVVGQQTHEIGVRMALGARASAVVWSVLRRALVLMAIGVAIGTAGALALTRLMAGLLYEIRSTDAATFIAAAVLLAALAVAASLIPAWRATRVDPLIALRAE
jgi:putative ABC transport system permease protein